MASVLVLFASGDEPESKKLMDLLQAKLGTSYNMNTIKGILAEDSTLDSELSSSRCVVLVASKQSSELIKQKTAEKDCGGIVMFDGALIQQHVQDDSLMDKMVVVQLGKGSDDHVPGGFDQKKVFRLGETALDAENPALDEIVDAIKGTVSTKVNDKSAKKDKKKKNCTQM